PVVLAGGLTPENVGEAVRAVEPYGVDVATGVERAGGVKDHDALEAFVAGAREAAEVTTA
ncbi:MAG: phosphoribosylanthranilate isomerase, partial [Halobacteriaceae archaeon]